MVNLFREPESGGCLIEVLRDSKERSLRENADYEVRYHVPLETIHQHLASLGKSREIAELLKMTQAGHRHYKSVMNRVMRGDIRTSEQFEAALEPAESIVEEVMTKRLELTSAVIKQLQSLRTKNE